MAAKILKDIRAAFVPLPNALPRGIWLFYHLYLAVLWLLATIAVVRWTLYLIHVYNPSLSFLPPYHRLVEFLICLSYTAPAVAWFLLKLWLVRAPELRAAWDDYTKRIEHPFLSADERWGGSQHATTMIVVVVAGFLMFTAFFILRTAFRG